MLQKRKSSKNPKNSHRKLVRSCVFSSHVGELLGTVEHHHQALRTCAHETLDCLTSRFNIWVRIASTVKFCNLYALFVTFAAVFCGWRRCVCQKAQVTLIELNRVTEKIRARKKNKAQHNQTKQQTPQQHQHTQNETNRACISSGLSEPKRLS